MSTRTTNYASMTNQELVQAAIDDWATPNYAAAPYIQSMREQLASGQDPLTDAYYYDSPGEQVLRFLGNSASWRGDVARGVKAELRKRMGLG